MLGAFVAGLLADQPLGNLRFPFVKLGIARADEMQVAALEGRQLRAQVRRAQLAVGEIGLERGLLLELARKLLIFGFGRTSVRRLQRHGLRL